MSSQPLGGRVGESNGPGQGQRFEESRETAAAPRPDADSTPLTSLQKGILKALKGMALKKEVLAKACSVDPSRLYRPGGIRELRSLHVVEHKEGVGYYRPDEPPPDSITPKCTQIVPAAPPTSP